MKHQKYRNKFEAKVAPQYPNHQYEAIKLPYTIEHQYLPDLYDPLTNSVVEMKGRFPSDERRKMLAVKRAHPHMSFHMVFQNPNQTISKVSKTTYAAWCDKHGISWSKG